ncbi:FKBP-type peptidyl-prolyl cis-trans isomerases 1 [Longilinea arvoryzae]|uniref:peptidylprolyl isomerase n=1 Tax=Longilinea arvoryzae TaxID=360412 RepID=A0A0S7BEN0_9CHLR|nr:FKBP-type peptidyl-prolyl cis-trans isomerase [Longilinea arvoryzae]GAP12870.1 FKBP-type peptidyl-prolyl cis-trans isomerases 1 [Longilinea arvoryzae]
MKSNKKGLSLALALAALTILSLVLAGCQSSSSATATATPAVTATAAPTEAATAAPTQEPIVLKGATTTDSGLQYLEEVAGTGAKPQAGELITMNYIATLPDGTELGNTYTDGKSVTVLWGKGLLLPGWEEGIGLMKVGTKAKMVLPPDLAYGESGYGSFIPANSQIVLEVELVSTEKPPEPTAVTDDKLTTSSTGLKYYDLAVGDGEEAIKGASVTTHYTLWVKTDTGYDYIDSSLNDSPLDFTVGLLDTVFKGWDEGVTGMKVGGKRYLVIPPDLGMGDQANGIIPANSTLVMEIQLTKVVLPQVMTPVDSKDYTITATGLKYYDIVTGTGAAAETGKTLVVNYTGWLEDGTQFDSSYTSGSTFSFQLGAGKVISGWEEGLVGMKVGGKRQLVIPASLGYGDSAVGSIPANSTLIFEVELVDVQDTK